MAILGFTWSRSAFYLVFPLAAIFGLIAIPSLRCPKCLWPVQKGTIGEGRWEVDYWSVWVPKRCRKCGHPLS